MSEPLSKSNPVVHDLLKKIGEMHDRKNADYADPESGNFYSNFDYAAFVSAQFTHPIDRVFATMIGIKMARLIELTKPGRAVNNESVEDTRVDLATYSVLWSAYHESAQIHSRNWKRERKNSNRRSSTGVRGQSRRSPFSRTDGAIPRPDAKECGTESQLSLANERK